MPIENNLNSANIDIQKKFLFFNLAILLLPINLTVSGILFLYILITSSVKPNFKSLQIPALKEPLLVLTSSQRFIVFLRLIKNNLLRVSYFSLTAFIVYSLIQGIFSLQPLLHYAGLIGHYLVYIFFFISIRKVINDDSKILNTCKAIILSGSIASIIGIFSYFKIISSFSFIYLPVFGGNYLFNFDLGKYNEIRASGFSMHPNILGCYLLITIFITLYLINSSTYKNESDNFILTKIINKFVSAETIYYLLFLQGICLILTRSRGSLLSLFLGLLILIMLKPKILKNFLPLIIGLLLIIAVFPSNYFHLFRSIIDLNNGSNLARLEVWITALKIIKDFPLGVGILNYESIYKGYLQYGHEYIPHAHNWYLHTCIESGFFGVISFFIFYFSLIIFFIKNLDRRYIYFPIILIIFSSFNLTDYVLTDTRICLLIMLVIILSSRFIKIDT